MKKFLYLAPLIALTPLTASALVAQQVAGAFNILVGLMLVASFLIFGSGFVRYIARLGTEHRSQGLDYMEYGISVLFVLVVILAAVKFIQDNSAVASFLVGLAIVGVAGWVALTVFAAQGEEEEEH